MSGKRWMCLAVFLGGMLVAGTSWGQESQNYNGKMFLLLQRYFDIQKSLSNDSLDGVKENAHNIVQLIKGIRLLVADKLPPGGKKKLEQIKRGAGGVGNDDILVARQYFKLLSGVIIEYLEIVGLPDSLKNTPLYVYYCPMFEANWMQKDRNLKNPFYGSIMLKYGQLEGNLQSRVTSAFNGF